MNIVCYGDSNTWGYDPRSYLGDRYPEQFRWPELLAAKADWNVINMGRNGREIPTTAFVPPADTDLLIIMLGTNDLLQGLRAEAVGARMAGFLESIPFPAERIILVVPPSLKPGEWVQDPHLIAESVQLSEVYRKAAASMNIQLLDTQGRNISLSYDGVHFTEIGHVFFSEIIYHFVIDIL